MGIISRNRILNCFTDSQSETTVAVRVFCQHISAGLGFVAGAGDAGGSVGFHHHAAVGLAVKAYFDHVYFAFHVEEFTGNRKCDAPLTGAGLGGNTLDTLFLVVIGLRNSCIQFMAAGRAGTFVFIIDSGRRIQFLFQLIGAMQNGRTVRPVIVLYFIGNFDIALRAEFLHNQFHGE